MKKIFVGLIAFVSAFMFSNVKVNASEYNGDLGYQYMSNGVMFNYYTDRNDVNVYVEIEGVSEVKTQLLEKMPNSIGYNGFVLFDKNFNEGSSYRIKMCDVADSNSCEYVLDAFSHHLSEKKNRNTVIDTTEIDSKWNGISTYASSEYERSIYALDVEGFARNVEIEIEGEQRSYSMFERLSSTSTKNDAKMGLRYLKTLGFSHIEMSTLYDSNNYFAINRKYANNTDAYSAINEYQAMILEFKKYNLNVVMKTNFTNVGTELEKSLLAMSTSAVVDHKLNYNDPLVQRYIIEVYKYWASNYHIDGFYIEDSKLYPQEFLTNLISQIMSVNGGTLVYSNSDSTTYTASDDLQELLIGSLEELDGQGIISGNHTEENMKDLIEAMFSGYYTNRTNYKNANKVINNFGSLSGLDIHSKISATVNVSNAVLNKYKLALYTVFASAGTPRVVAGNEFLNTTIVENDPTITDKICITSSICYAMGNEKFIDWSYLNRYGNLSTLANNYRKNYYYQFPSSYSMGNANSININEELLDKGVLFITFNYGGVEHGEIERSLFIVNYSNQEITVNKISNKSYSSTSPLLGKINDVDGKETKIGSEMFYVYTEVKIINIPKWVYLVIGLGLIGFIAGFRQLLIYLLKKKRGIDYSEFKENKKENKKGKGTQKTKTSEPSIFEFFVADDPLVKERKEALKKAKEAKRQKKLEEQKENKEKENDGK